MNASHEAQVRAHEKAADELTDRIIGVLSEIEPCDPTTLFALGRVMAVMIESDTEEDPRMLRKNMLGMLRIIISETVTALRKERVEKERIVTELERGGNPQ